MKRISVLALLGLLEHPSSPGYKQTVMARAVQGNNHHDDAVSDGEAIPIMELADALAVAATASSPSGIRPGIRPVPQHSAHFIGR